MNSATIINFAQKHWIYIVLAVVLIISISLLSTKEGFQATSDAFVEIASYPEVFSKTLLQNAKALSFDNVYTAFESVVAPEKELSSIQGLELPSTTAVVPLSVGDGMAVDVAIQVPQQITDVPAQKPVDVEAQKTPTEIPVAQQTITIPQQEGVIPGKIDSSGRQVMIPVTIPSQTVTVDAQNAYKTTLETFRV